VLAIAGGFIQPGCDLGVPANPSLTVTNNGTIGVGTSLTFDMSSIPNVDASTLFCQMLTGGAAASISQPLNNCVVPDISGPVAIYITNSSQPLANSQQVQFAQEIIMGPTIAFIDTTADSIMQAIRSSPAGNSTTPPPPTSSSGTDPSSDPSSTSTISPEEASSIIAGASSTYAASLPTGTSPTDPNLSTGGNNPATNSTTDGNTVVLGWSTAPAPQPA